MIALDTHPELVEVMRVLDDFCVAGVSEVSQAMGRSRTYARMWIYALETAGLVERLTAPVLGRLAPKHERVGDPVRRWKKAEARYALSEAGVVELMRREKEE